MAAPDIDSYLAALRDDQREVLERLRRTIRDLVPDAEEGISYGAPVFRLGGRPVAGFAAAKNHLSYLPHSGSALGTMEDELEGYVVTKGSLHFTPDRPLPADLVARLVAVRLRELEG